MKSEVKGTATSKRLGNTEVDESISNIYFVIKLYVFRSSSVPIIRSFLLYARQLVLFMQVM